MKSIKISGIILFVICLNLPGLAADRLTVFVSIAPQKHFVQQIGKDLVNVRVMVPPGANPATYEPKPRQMADLTKTRIYFAIGVPFENAWLKKIAAANPKMKVVPTQQGIKKIPMTAHHHHDVAAESNPQSEQNHSGLDPHIWLSPPLVKIQARTILNTLQEVNPSHEGKYKINYQQFMTQIDGLDKKLKMIFAEKQGQHFMVFHPSWGYFAQAYGLKQVAVEVEGKDPKPAQLKALIEHARNESIKVIFVQPQFSTKSAALVAREIGGQVVFADPLAEDWPGNLQNVAQKLKEALK